MNNQVSLFQQLYTDLAKKKKKDLQQENKRLKKMVESYANDLQKRYVEMGRNTNRLWEQHERLLADVQESLKILCPNV